MTTPLSAFTLNKKRLRRELREFAALLGAPDKELREREDIQPFFKARPNLASLIGMFQSRLGVPTLLNTEFGLFGDFACDLAVGNARNHHYCFVEFEDAGRGSVFKKGKKGVREWGPRLEQGISQIVDWFRCLDDMRQSARFRELFGSDRADYAGVVIVRRDAHLSRGELERVDWRSTHTRIAGKSVLCITFDELYRTLEERVTFVT
jgi:hypothetical protein